MMREYDVIVIGAGPGGLSAAAAAKRFDLKNRALTAGTLRNSLRVAVLEREEIPGGILNQCVHDGFGIVRYGEQLSGPEYAGIEEKKAADAGAEILTGCMVTEIRKSRAGEDQPGDFQVTVICRTGRQILRGKSIVLATGCRERTRGMLSIPGTRPAGIYTAGVAQNLINRKNMMVGRRAVILGSGDIGLIMARRLTLEGAQVLCAAEVMGEPSGLARNVQQCLYDFGIPLHLRTTVSDIYGKDRLEAVELSQVDGHLRPVPGTRRRVECDTLILSVGLIPENEVAKTAGVSLDPKTGGARTDRYLQTDVPGIFACGNARAVMDLADFVSEQGELAGTNAAIYAAMSGLPLHAWKQDPHNVARKGLPEKGSVTCTLCPKGCQVRIAPADWIVTGNGCPRGKAFAIQEMTDPCRILTTTIRVQRTAQMQGEGKEGAEELCGGKEKPASSFAGFLLPVRSDRPVPLSELQPLAQQISRTVIRIPENGSIETGEILLRGLGSPRVNIIAERTCR